MDPKDGRVVSNFITQALSGNPITVYGDGSQTRSFCYIDDLIEGLIMLMNSSCQDPVNLGNPNEMTIKELAEKVIKICASDSEIVYNELPIDDPKKRCPNIKKAKEVLGWSPKINIDRGIGLSVDWFKRV